MQFLSSWLWSVLSSVFVSGLLTAGLIFIAKNWIGEKMKNAIKHEYDQKLETLRAQLKSTSDKEIEQLRAKLQIEAAGRNIRLTRVFEKNRRNYFKHIYKALELRRAVDKLVEFNADKEKRLLLGQSVDRAAEAFFTYFLPNMIYIPKTTAEKIVELTLTFQSLPGALHEIAMIDIEKQPGLFEEELAKYVSMSDTIPALLSALEDNFRNILGFEGISFNE